MKFGTLVNLRRGGSRPPGEVGCPRTVKATYIGAREHIVFCRLEEDDPLSSFGDWSKKGDVGHWSRSAITKIE